jgi:hypothetical protein
MRWKMYIQVVLFLRAPKRPLAGPDIDEFQFKERSKRRNKRRSLRTTGSEIKIFDPILQKEQNGLGERKAGAIYLHDSTEN